MIIYSPQSVGRLGEHLATRYLKQQGYFIWERNWKHPSGELDIVARKDRTLTFIEVKTRLHLPEKSAALAETNYDQLKHRKVEKLLEIYLNTSRVRRSREKVRSVQIDLISIDLCLFCRIMPRIRTLAHYPAVWSMSTCDS